MPRWLRYTAFVFVLGAIVLGHVALWRTEDVPLEAKQRLTVLNALGWGVIILPAVGVSLWLRAHQRRNRE